MGSTKAEAEMGVGTDFLICAREVDCGNLLPNWIAAAIKSGLWELIAKLDSSCYQPTNTAPLPCLKPHTLGSPPKGMGYEGVDCTIIFLVLQMS